MIQDNIAQILGRIEAICQKIAQDPAEVTLVGVTKYADADQISEAIDAGLAHIGENKVQEAEKKFSHIKQDVQRHMIGHLQSNKANRALELFDLIESVDSIRLIDALDGEAAKRGKAANILLQINTAGEAQKFGFAPEHVNEALEHIDTLDHIRVRGLMAIAPLTDDKEVIRHCFGDLRSIFERVKQQYPAGEKIKMTHLSMGMSGDFEIAIEEGSNMVRIGRAIFGD